MAYCRKCGAPISEMESNCPRCGSIQDENRPAVTDNGGFAWGLLGFCIPIVGLVLFLVWREQKPRTAKAVGVGALASVIVGVVWYLLIMVIGIGTAIL